MKEEGGVVEQGDSGMVRSRLAEGEEEVEEEGWWYRRIRIALGKEEGHSGATVTKKEREREEISRSEEGVRERDDVPLCGIGDDGSPHELVHWVRCLMDLHARNDTTPRRVNCDGRRREGGRGGSCRCLMVGGGRRKSCAGRGEGRGAWRLLMRWTRTRRRHAMWGDH